MLSKWSSSVKERQKVKRSINGVIKRPKLRRINHTHNVDIIIEESPEELLSISPVDTSRYDDVINQRNVSGSDHGSTVSLTSFEKHLLGGDNSYEDENRSLSNISLSSIDKMSISRIDDVMANVNNCDVISINQHVKYGYYVHSGY